MSIWHQIRRTHPKKTVALCETHFFQEDGASENSAHGVSDLVGLGFHCEPRHGGGVLFGQDGRTALIRCKGKGSRESVYNAESVMIRTVGGPHITSTRLTWEDAKGELIVIPINSAQIATLRNTLQALHQAEDSRPGKNQIWVGIVSFSRFISPVQLGRSERPARDPHLTAQPASCPSQQFRF